MSDGNTELILEMIDIFTSQVEEFRNEMDVLYKRGDFENLGKLAHKAKSSVSIFGMTEISNKLKELEILCMKKKDTGSYPEIITKFKTDCSQAVSELIDYKRNLTSK